MANRKCRVVCVEVYYVYGRPCDLRKPLAVFFLVIALVIEAQAFDYIT